MGPPGPSPCYGTGISFKERFIDVTYSTFIAINSDLQIGEREWLWVWVYRTEHALWACGAKIVEVRVLSTLNSYSWSSWYSNRKVAIYTQAYNLFTIIIIFEDIAGKKKKRSKDKKEKLTTKQCIDFFH